MTRFDRLLADVRACTICAHSLPHGPRPVIRASRTARILIASQAPGRRVHASGIPFDDPSGDRLRDWMSVTREQFYDDRTIAILPMGFCYPGSASSGDLPPRPECAPAWRQRILSDMRSIELTLVIGRYAMAYHMADARSVTDAVRSWKDRWPSAIPLPHPSPRNKLWIRRNPWFETDLLPALRERIAVVLADAGHNDEGKTEG